MSSTANSERPHLPDGWLEDRLLEHGLTDEAIAEVVALADETAAAIREQNGSPRSGGES